MHIVVTTIQSPTKAMEMLSAGLEKTNGTLWVVGDRKGPAAFDLPRTKFFHIDEQKDMGFTLAHLLPEKHYTRKNLGYLAAIREGAECIVETDDDNLPRPEFFAPRVRTIAARTATNPPGWCNAYKAFTDAHIWPRGLPLEAIQTSEPTFDNQERGTNNQELGTNNQELGTKNQELGTKNQEQRTNNIKSLIQQGLADENPDVDAAYRLILPLPLDFNREAPLALPPHVWCPFNSQNTTFFKEAFPLLYLPSFCSFRMTDIWRSFVAQRCLWAMDSSLVFHSATVWQERNDHNLLRDFKDEVPGYLNNERIRVVLDDLDLKKGKDVHAVCANLLSCYTALTQAQIVGSGEIPLVEAWVNNMTLLIKI